MAPYCSVFGYLFFVKVRLLDSPSGRSTSSWPSSFSESFRESSESIIIFYLLRVFVAFGVGLQNKFSLSAVLNRWLYWRRWWWWFLSFGCDWRSFDWAALPLLDFFEGWGPYWLGLLPESRWNNLLVTDSSLGLVILWALRKCWDIRLTMALRFLSPHWWSRSSLLVSVDFWPIWQRGYRFHLRRVLGNR